jgi:hypothetical protein
MRLKLKASQKTKALVFVMIGLIAVAWYWYQKHTIVGFWGGSDGPIVLEFRRDGTFIDYYSKTGARAGHYSYSPIRRQLLLEVSPLSIPMTPATVSINRDIMAITFFDMTHTIVGPVQFHRVDSSKTNILSYEEEIKRQLNQRAIPDTSLFHRLGL